MRPLKVLGLVLVAIFALGITATSALAELELPDVHVLAGEAYPLHLNFADDGKTKTVLQSTGGGKAEGKGVSVLLLIKELSSLGTFEAIFLNVKLGTAACTGEGDKVEEVLTKGEFHIVHLKTKPLTLGIAFLLELVLFLCGKLKVHVLGCALSSLNATKEMEDLTEVGGNLEADKKGKNLLTKYIDDNEKELECKLESNVGGGFAQSSEEIEGTVLLKALESKMFEFLKI